MCVNELGNATFQIFYLEQVNYTMSPKKEIGDFWRFWMILYGLQINFVSFRTFKDPLFHKPVCGQVKFMSIKVS